MIEPSTIERAELPETTAKYLADLEQENAALTDDLERMAQALSTISQTISTAECQRIARETLG